MDDIENKNSRIEMEMRESVQLLKMKFYDVRISNFVQIHENPNVHESLKFLMKFYVIRILKN